MRPLLCLFLGHRMRPYQVPPAELLADGVFMPLALRRRFGTFGLSALRGMPISYCSRCGETVPDWSTMRLTGDEPDVPDEHPTFRG